MNEIISSFNKFFEFSSSATESSFRLDFIIEFESEQILLFCIFQIFVTTGRVNSV